MLRFVLLSTFALLASFPAMADPNTPEIAKQALAYRQTLEAAPKSAKLGALLSGIRQAQSLGAVGETLHLYEQLVALEPNNFRSWLKLGLTWHEADKGAAGGLNAAWNAYENAHGAPDQVEALLLMSAVLRDQLAAAREAYQTNSRDLAGVTEVLRGEERMPERRRAPQFSGGRGEPSGAQLQDPRRLRRGDAPRLRAGWRNRARSR